MQLHYRIKGLHKCFILHSNAHRSSRIPQSFQKLFGVLVRSGNPALAVLLLILLHDKAKIHPQICKLIILLVNWIRLDEER